jgi:peptidoglycan L-alanyl-D-glutamate endopeptidase CwlK
MTYSLSQKSLDKLQGVDASLIRVVKRAITITNVDFTVGEGVRSLERQKELVAAGKSQTMQSKHLVGHAVDLWVIKNGVITWDKQAYIDFAIVMKQAAKDEGVVIRWGGDFKSFFDGPHFELV